MADRYEHHSLCVFNLGYHIIFCPKHRRKLPRRYIKEQKETAQRKAGSLSSHG